MKRKFMSKEEALKIAQKYCNDNNYSFDKLAKLDFISGYPFCAFGLYPKEEEYPEDALMLKGKGSLPKVAIFINYDGTVDANEENLYLIIK